MVWLIVRRRFRTGEPSRSQVDAYRSKGLNLSSLDTLSIRVLEVRRGHHVQVLSLRPPSVNRLVGVVGHKKEKKVLEYLTV